MMDAEQPNRQVARPLGRAAYLLVEVDEEKRPCRPPGRGAKFAALALGDWWCSRKRLEICDT
eukprot:scaffold165681_cov29-Tisochrysis_lutea.AAC.2